VSLAVFALPASVRQSLVLQYHAPTPVTMYAAHFVHFRLAHLLSNLLLYGLLVPATYAVATGVIGEETTYATAQADRQLFWTLFAGLLVAVPVTLSALNIALGTPAVGYGFSGVNMGIFGLFTLFLGRRLDGRGSRTYRYGGALFATVAAGISGLVLPSAPMTLGLAGGAACLAVAFGISGSRLRRQNRQRSEATDSAQSAVVNGFLLSLFALVAAMIFGVAEPTSPIVLYVHFLGFALAYTAGYATTLVKTQVATNDKQEHPDGRREPASSRRR
jgi:hypothetical protein